MWSDFTEPFVFFGFSLSQFGHLTIERLRKAA